MAGVFLHDLRANVSKDPSAVNYSAVFIAYSLSNLAVVKISVTTYPFQTLTEKSYSSSRRIISLATQTRFLFPDVNCSKMPKSASVLSVLIA